MYSLEKKKNNIPFHKQPNDYSCVPTSLKMLLDYYIPGNVYSLDDLSLFCKTNRNGTNIYTAAKVLEAYGLDLYKLRNYKRNRLQLDRFIGLITEGYAVLIGYVSDIHEHHLAVITGYDLKKAVFYLNDPWYGKDFEIPIGLILNSNNEFYITKGY